MSSPMETIVRPWVGGGVAPPQQYFSQGQPGVPPVIIRAGRGGQGRTLNGSISIQQTFYVTAYVNEKSHADFGTAF